MDNNQIRLSLLCQYYRAKFNGKDYGQIEENPELKDVDPKILSANLSYLVDKGLINGNKTYTSGGVIVTSTDITAWGMDIVENILTNSMSQLDQKITSEINKESSTDKKLNKFYEMCVKIEPMCEVAVKVAGMILGNIK